MVTRLLYLITLTLILEQPIFGQTEIAMNDYAKTLEQARGFTRPINLEKRTIFYLTNDYRISVTKEKKYDSMLIKLNLDDGKTVAQFKIDPDDFDKSHPLNNPANIAFGPFTFTLESPTDLKIDRTKFNIPFYLPMNQPANAVGLMVDFKGVLRAQFDNNSASASYQFMLSDQSDQKELNIDSEQLTNPVTWKNYVIKFDFAGSEGVSCKVSPKGMDELPLHLPILKGATNPPLTIDTTAFKVDSYYSYPNPDNKEEMLYGVNLSTPKPVYSPYTHIQITDSQLQKAALAFGGYFIWLKPDTDLLMFHKPEYEVPFEIGIPNETLDFEGEFQLTFEGCTVFQYEFSAAASFAFILEHDGKEESFEFSSESNDSKIISWNGFELELLEMIGDKRVRLKVRKK